MCKRYGVGVACRSWSARLGVFYSLKNIEFVMMKTCLCTYYSLKKKNQIYGMGNLIIEALPITCT